LIISFFSEQLAGRFRADELSAVDTPLGQRLRDLINGERRRLSWHAAFTKRDRKPILFFTRRMNMDTFARIYTPAEAAAVSGIGIKSVHNAIDKRIVDTVPELGRRSSGVVRRALTGDGLLRLKLWYGVGSTLPADRRRRLFEEIKAAPTARTVKADDLLIIDVAEARRQLKARIGDLDEAEAAIGRVKGVMGGEPVFKGTRIPVRMIVSMLAQGSDEADILDGYPSLTPRMIELARIWVAAHPTRGRPKKLSELGLKAKSSKRVPLQGPHPSTGSKTRVAS
jgi:uncharacterized protein (DUF433 family)